MVLKNFRSFGGNTLKVDPEWSTKFCLLTLNNCFQQIKMCGRPHVFYIWWTTYNRLHKTVYSFQMTDDCRKEAYALLPLHLYYCLLQYDRFVEVAHVIEPVHARLWTVNNGEQSNLNWRELIRLCAQNCAQFSLVYLEQVNTRSSIEVPLKGRK